MKTKRFLSLFVAILLCFSSFQFFAKVAATDIEIDLDDGVKVNYAKFQGIEIINDSGAKVKKDLLVPIK